jgi:hypothetical protein
MEQSTALTALLEAIERARIERGMSNRKFSTQVLGISHSYLSLLRAGKRPLTPNLAVKFMRRLPDLAPAVTEFVLSQSNDHRGG